MKVDFTMHSTIVRDLVIENNIPFRIICPVRKTFLVSPVQFVMYSTNKNVYYDPQNKTHFYFAKHFRVQFSVNK